MAISRGTRSKALASVKLKTIKAIRTENVRKQKRREVREKKKQKKLLYKQKAQQIKLPKQIEIRETAKNLGYLDDIIYSTFEANLVEMGEYDKTLKEIVDKSISLFGFSGAMERLERYFSNVKDKNNIFSVPLNYEGVATKAVSKFASEMYGRPLSLEEIEMFEQRLDYLVSEDIRGAGVGRLRAIQRTD